MSNPPHWLTSTELTEALRYATGSLRLTAAIVMARELLEERDAALNRSLVGRLGKQRLDGCAKVRGELTASQTAAEISRCKVEEVTGGLSNERARTESVKQERDGLHRILKALVDYAVDVLGMPTSAILGPDAPLHIVRKLHEDLVRCRIERDATIARAEKAEKERDFQLSCALRQQARAESAERLALERYQEIEELHAAMGEASQRVTTPIAALRAELADATARRDEAVREVPLWLQHAITKMHGLVDQTDPNDPVGIALTVAGLERNPEAYDDPTDQAAAAERESIASWLEGYYDLYPTQRKTLVLAIRTNAHKEG